MRNPPVSGTGRGPVAALVCRLRARRVDAVAVLTILLAAFLPGTSYAARSYEMVTPVDKASGISDTNQGFLAGATDDGNHFFFISQQAILKTALDSPWIYRADRGTDGWSLTSPLAHPLRTVGAVGLVNWDDKTLGMTALTNNPFDPLDADFFGFGAFDLYRFDASGREVAWLSKGEINNDKPLSIAALSRASTPDGSRAVFNVQSDAGDEPSLTADATGLTPSVAPLYEYADGHLHLVEVANDGSRLSDGTTYLGSKFSAFDAMSADGARVYFTATSDWAPAPTGKEGLYLRTDASTTLPIPPSPIGANADAVYVGATRDGSEVFFLSPDQLTADDTDASVDLYRLDLATQHLTRLSAGASQADVEATPVWASDDGSRVYFTARGQLVPGVGTPGTPKTYLWDHGTLKFVADAGLLEPTGGNLEPQCADTRATPDGRYFIAATTASLLPQDQDGGAKDVYWYDAQTGKLEMVSTGPADTNGGYDADIFGNLPFAFVHGVCARTDRMTHPLSDDGQHVFFQTAGSLVPKDVDGRIDVYEWSAQTDRVKLLTLGTVPAQYANDPLYGNSFFLDATPSGHDVFVATQDRLVPEDRDEMTDIYDIREGGGFPTKPPLYPCSDSGCQGVPSTPPALQTPGSETLTGAGPVVSTRDAPAKARLGIVRPTRDELRRFARSGRLGITVTTTTRGRVRLEAVVTSEGREVIVGSGIGTATGGARLRVAVRATPLGQRVMRSRSLLRLSLRAVQSSGVKAERTVVVHRGMA